mmetsp:Transcript_84112/g.223289  ORF Transcript_84112/g.223289 Transcript_84112/m.223289 type:complete len:245 (+) Transcript_84112:816-1550(+)
MEGPPPHLAARSWPLPRGVAGDEEERDHGLHSPRETEAVHGREPVQVHKHDARQTVQGEGHCEDHQAWSRHPLVHEELPQRVILEVEPQTREATKDKLARHPSSLRVRYAKGLEHGAREAQDPRAPNAQEGHPDLALVKVRPREVKVTFAKRLRDQRVLPASPTGARDKGHAGQRYGPEAQGSDKARDLGLILGVVVAGCDQRDEVAETLQRVGARDGQHDAYDLPYQGPHIPGSHGHGHALQS